MLLTYKKVRGQLVVAVSLIIAGFFWWIVVLFLILLNASKVNAAFYPSKDIRACNVIPAVGVFIDKLPDERGITEIVYNVSDVVGERASLIGNTVITDYVDKRLGYAKRLGLATYVASPPGATLKIGGWFYNFSGRPVPIYGVDIPFELQGESVLDVVDINGGSLQNKRIEYLFATQRIVRQGLFWGISFHRLLTNKTLYTGAVLGELVVKQPVQFDLLSLTCSKRIDGKVMAQVRVCLKNASTSESFSPFVSIGNDVKSYPLVAGERKCKTFSLLLHNKDELLTKKVTLSVNKLITRCFSKGDVRGDSLDPLSKAVFLRRGDLSAPQGWFGYQPSLARVAGEGICISVIPYKVVSSVPACEFLGDDVNVDLSVTPRCTDTTGHVSNVAVRYVSNKPVQQSTPLSIKVVDYPINHLAIDGDNILVHPGVIRLVTNSSQEVKTVFDWQLTISPLKEEPYENILAQITLNLYHGANVVRSAKVPLCKYVNFNVRSNLECSSQSSGYFLTFNINMDYIGRPSRLVFENDILSELLSKGGAVQIKDSQGAFRSIVPKQNGNSIEFNLEGLNLGQLSIRFSIPFKKDVLLDSLLDRLVQSMVSAGVKDGNGRMITSKPVGVYDGRGMGCKTVSTGDLLSGGKGAGAGSGGSSSGCSLNSCNSGSGQSGSSVGQGGGSNNTVTTSGVGSQSFGSNSNSVGSTGGPKKRQNFSLHTPVVHFEGKNSSLLSMFSLDDGQFSDSYLLSHVNTQVDEKLSSLATVSSHKYQNGRMSSESYVFSPRGIINAFVARLISYWGAVVVGITSGILGVATVRKRF